MRVKIKLCDENAKVPYKTYDSDFCYDVVATSEEHLGLGIWKYGIGLAFQIDRVDENIEFGETLLDRFGNAYGRTNDKKINLRNSPIKLSIDFRPRSSIWKTGMVLSNSEGTIDEKFTGEVSAVFYHLLPWRKRYHVGDRIGQIKIGTTFPISYLKVNELDETERGEGGYGSTGK